MPRGYTARLSSKEGLHVHSAAPTLYEWIGGAEVCDRLLILLYERVTSDALLAPVFAHMDTDHAAHVGQFVAEVFGGPKAYSDGHGKHGSHAGMIARHRGRNLTEAQRRRWVNLLLDCADEVRAPDDPECRSAFVAYLEWGSRLAVLNSQPGATPPLNASPMPHWGWGEVKGPYTG